MAERATGQGSSKMKYTETQTYKVKSKPADKLRGNKNKGEPKTNG